MTFSRVRRLYIMPEQRRASIYRTHFPYAFTPPSLLLLLLPSLPPPPVVPLCHYYHWRPVARARNVRERNNYLKARISGGI